MKKRNLLKIGLCTTTVLAWISTNAAVVQLTDATATFSQSDSFGSFPVQQAIDGVLTTGYPYRNGWSVDGASHWLPGPQAAVFQTASDVSFNGQIHFSLVQDYWNLVYGEEFHTLGCFRISYTTADRSLFADGLAVGGNIGPDSIWHPIMFSSFSDYYRNGTLDPGTTASFRTDGSVLIGGNNHAGTYFLSDDLYADSVTGFRIDLLMDPSLPYGGPGRSPANGNVVLTEFQVSDEAFVPLNFGGLYPPGSSPPEPEPETVPEQPSFLVTCAILVIPFGLQGFRFLRRHVGGANCRV